MRAAKALKQLDKQPREPALNDNEEYRGDGPQPIETMFEDGP